jgi:hypothetical protein
MHQIKCDAFSWSCETITIMVLIFPTLRRVKFVFILTKSDAASGYSVVVV